MTLKAEVKPIHFEDQAVVAIPVFEPGSPDEIDHWLAVELYGGGFLRGDTPKQAKDNLIKKLRVKANQKTKTISPETSSMIIDNLDDQVVVFPPTTGTRGQWTAYHAPTRLAVSADTPQKAREMIDLVVGAVASHEFAAQETLEYMADQAQAMIKHVLGRDVAIPVEIVDAVIRSFANVSGYLPTMQGNDVIAHAYNVMGQLHDAGGAFDPADPMHKEKQVAHAATLAALGWVLKQSPYLELTQENIDNAVEYLKNAKPISTLAEVLQADDLPVHKAVVNYLQEVKPGTWVGDSLIFDTYDRVHGQYATGLAIGNLITWGLVEAGIKQDDGRVVKVGDNDQLLPGSIFLRIANNGSSQSKQP